jgi:CBS domain-containing protein
MRAGAWGNYQPGGRIARIGTKRGRRHHCAGRREPRPHCGLPDELLHDAVTKMLRHNIGRLPVVSRQNSQRLIGYLGRANLMTARVRQLEEEHFRERGLRLLSFTDVSLWRRGGASGLLPALRCRKNTKNSRT